MAASATFALKSGEWFRRVRSSSSLLIRTHNRARYQAEIPLIAPTEIVEPPLARRQTAQSLALLRRLTAAPRSPASKMRCTCRRSDAASFAVISVVGLVPDL